MGSITGDARTGSGSDIPSHDAWSAVYPVVPIDVKEPRGKRKGAGDIMSSMDRFGCNRCFQAAAEAASEARRHFVEISRLVDESHFIVRILECPHCRQRCVSVFTETIDWSQGDDAQYWSLLPLTDAESEQLISQGEDVDIRLIESLGRDRRYLQVDFPTGKPKRALWAAGNLWIGPHD